MPTSNKNNNTTMQIKTLLTVLALSSLNNAAVDAFIPSTKMPSHTSYRESLTAPSRLAPLNAFAMNPQAAMSAVDSFFQTQPYVAAFLTCSVKASAADMVAQTQEDKTDESPDTLQPIKSASVQQSLSSAAIAAAVAVEPPSMSLQVPDAVANVDVSRNLGFLLYGGMYTGLAQNYLYTTLYPSWFSMDEGLTLVAKEVLLDNAIFGPLVCLPIAYSFKAAFTADGDITLDTIKKGLEKYVDDVMLRGLLTKYWMIWIPVQGLTFGVIPPHFRIPFVALVSFFWMCLLSVVSNSTDEEASSSTN